MYRKYTWSAKSLLFRGFRVEEVGGQDMEVLDENVEQVAVTATPPLHPMAPPLNIRSSQRKRRRCSECVACTSLKTKSQADAMPVGKLETTSEATSEKSSNLPILFSASTLRIVSIWISHNRTRTSAIPGTNMKANAQALPQKVTRLADAFLKDILSTTNAICALKFWTKIFRTLWCTDSARNSEVLEEEESDIVDRAKGEDVPLGRSFQRTELGRRPVAIRAAP